MPLFRSLQFILIFWLGCDRLIRTLILNRTFNIRYPVQYSRMIAFMLPHVLCYTPNYTDNLTK